MRFRVRNTGAREGKEVIQLYLRTNSRLVTMPVMELKKLDKISLQPGEECEVTFALVPADLAHLKPDFARIVEKCGYKVMVGASSGDIRLRGNFKVKR